MRTSFGLRRRGGMNAQVDVDILNAVKSVLTDVSSVSPSSEQRGDYGLGARSDTFLKYPRVLRENWTRLGPGSLCGKPTKFVGS